MQDLNMVDEITACIEEIRQMLIVKNMSYGNSALEPVRIFSRADTLEQLKVRIDDKLSRIMKGTELSGEATIDDLIGYLVLLKIARKVADRQSDQEFIQGQDFTDYNAAQGPDPLKGVIDQGLDNFYQRNPRPS